MSLKKARYFCIVSAVILFCAIVYNLSQKSAGNLWNFSNEAPIFVQDSIITSARVTTNPSSSTELVPVGITAGVHFYTDGIIVLGTESVSTKDGEIEPCEGLIFLGDIITHAEGIKLSNINELKAAIQNKNEGLKLTILRDKKSLDVQIFPKKCLEDGQYKIGSWCRDQTQGIGTITFYNPKTGLYGALGHGISDVDIKQPLSVGTGSIIEIEIKNIKKGQKGDPGELTGEISNKKIGNITKNTNLGIFGEINQQYKQLPSETLTIAAHTDIKSGPAQIRSNIEGGEIKEYDVYIESVNKNAKAEKSMVVRIVDPGLISRTNGIVQGMSGSPIIQNNKLVGAITHVFVQNPLKGYGVSIENMLACA